MSKKTNRRMKQYTAENMSSDIKAVREKQMGYLKAAKFHIMPGTTS